MGVRSFKNDANFFRNHFKRARNWDSSGTLGPTTPSGFSATGGTESESGGRTIHTFTESGTFTVVDSHPLWTVNYLCVGGGAGGGDANPAGGGGGGAGLL